MKRLCILSCYDSEGKVRNYLETYIKALKEIADDLVIVVNEPLTESGFDCLKKYTDKVYIRENKGYDAGAYKYIFGEMNYVLDEYDELVLTNDTCFGPFVPFTDIFAKMEKEKIDFWGMNYIENHIISHLQSNFLVFRKKVFEIVMKYFKQKINENTTDISDVYVNFEMGLFHFLVKEGYKFGYYTPLNNLDVYRAPNYCLRDYGFPFLKKKCFDNVYFKMDNCLDALRFISEHCEYNISDVLEISKTRYNIDLESAYAQKQELHTVQYSVWASDYTENDLKHFFEQNAQVYIYGAGIMAKKIYVKYKNMIKQMCGFIVSDKKDMTDCVLGENVFEISEIMDKNIGIVVAMNPKNTDEVRELLKEYRNVFFLFK